MESSCSPSSSSDATVPLFERRRGYGRPSLKVDCAAAFAVSASSSAHIGTVEDVSNMYIDLVRIGQGCHSRVYRAVHKKNGNQVALKVVRASDEEVVANAFAEFELLQQISHPNIIQVLDYFATGRRTVVVMSFFDGDQLGVAVKRIDESRLPEVTVRRLFQALLQALDYLHRKRILHRDVKPENVLVSEDFAELKLIDFNIGRYLLDGGALSPNCTPAYAPPEIRRGVAPAEAADIWGAGLCLCVMLTGQCAVHEGRVDTSRCEASEACRCILHSCLSSDHLMRPAAMTLLQQDWVCGADAENGAPPHLVKRRNSWADSRSQSCIFSHRGAVDRSNVQKSPLRTAASF